MDFVRMENCRKLIAYAAPMALFLALLALVSLLRQLGQTFWLASAEYWVYPLQTILCGALVAMFWRDYELRRPARLIFGLIVGVAVFALWIAPQSAFGFPPRLEGFNPSQFSGQPLLYDATVGMRFQRLVVVVPLVEEIFWRGFLLRFLIREDFEQVPFGTFSVFSFITVSVIFGFSHSRPDWLVAVITGAIYNLVAWRTRSLSTCVFTHATTNLLLGIWIMKTGQWGFW